MGYKNVHTLLKKLGNYGHQFRNTIRFQSNICRLKFRSDKRLKTSIRKEYTLNNGKYKFAILIVIKIIESWPKSK